MSPKNAVNHHLMAKDSFYVTFRLVAIQFKIKIKTPFDNTLVRNEEFIMKLNSEPQNMYKPLNIFKNTFYITYLATAP